jgi:hypothetical protein
VAIYSIPGMSPGSRRRGGGGRVVIGGKFRGTAAPRGNIVPYEPVKPDGTRAKRESAERARDVADAFEHTRNQERAKARFG